MKSPKSLLLFLLLGGMFLSGFHACTSFVLACLSRKPVPIAEAATILLVAAMITWIHHPRRWRRISVAAFHLTGSTFSFLWLWYRYREMKSPFWDLNWIRESIRFEGEVAGFILVLMFLFFGILWFAAVRLVIRPADPDAVGRRFDSGLAFFLLLFLVKLVVAVKGERLPLAHSTTNAILIYVALGLFSMGLVRTRFQSKTRDVSYLSFAGVFMSFAFMALMLGGGFLVLLQTELQEAAKAGAHLLKTAGRPLAPVLIEMVRFALIKGCRRDFRETQAPGGFFPVPAEEAAGESGILQSVFGVVALMMLFLLSGFFLYLFAKWLFSKTEAGKKKKGLWELLQTGFRTVKKLLGLLMDKVFQGLAPPSTPEHYYLRLLRWGRFSGLPPALAETPREYAVRLKNRFSRIHQEIRFLVDLHEEAVYGSLIPENRQLLFAKKVLRRMQSPRFWPDRFQSLCFPSRSDRKGPRKDGGKRRPEA